ncbi:MAG: IS66 family insertion sequence element accessory protein TnpB [Oscillospiraceae bacterium]|nr:IS66 family insertion sequence element accessory protein TnpB [Oscillospiraceae bacterium]
MRKSIDGLAYIVEQKFKLPAQSDMMFVFHNRHCDKVKILYWDGDGFCLLYKRLERGKFQFPKHITADKYTVTNTELEWLLHGLKIEDIKHYEKLKRKKFSTGNSDFNMA